MNFFVSTAPPPRRRHLLDIPSQGFLPPVIHSTGDRSDAESLPFLQKQMRAEEAKVVQEKAAKIKEWVTLKLGEVSGKLISGSLEWTCGGIGGPLRAPAFFCLLSAGP